MAWAGQLYRWTTQHGAHVQAFNFDADNEETVISGNADTPFSMASESTSLMNMWSPRRASMVVKRTAGSTALISVTLSGCVKKDDTWTTLITLTAKDTMGHWPVVDYTDATQSVGAYLYFKIATPTVGSGNTLDVYVQFSRT